VSHAEDLASATSHYSDAITKIAQLAEQLDTCEAKNAALEAENVALKQENAELKKQIEELQPGPHFLWRDEFEIPPDDERYIRAAADPDNDFTVTPNGLDCRFITGKTGGPHASGATNKVLRSELLIRVPGTNNAWREEIGKHYRNEFAFRLPVGYAPAVPNETTVIYQCWQDQSVRPPVQIQLIDPAATADPLIVRLVLTRPGISEERVWKMPVERGVWYHVDLLTKWSFGPGGAISLAVNDEEEYFEERSNCFDFSQGMAPHLGQYLPGSHNDPVDKETRVQFGHWRISLA
jgi:polysaccharide lyase-like protein